MPAPNQFDAPSADRLKAERALTTAAKAKATEDQAELALWNRMHIYKGESQAEVKAILQAAGFSMGSAVWECEKRGLAGREWRALCNLSHS